MVAGTVVDRGAAKYFTERVRAENYAFYSTDLGQAALKDLQQTFPHPWLYVGELLQNAVDAGAKKIRLAILPDSSGLVVEHDGSAFNQDHVRALCARGLSTKGAGTVGFMGIGFKAVFQSFQCADIASGPWRFRLCVKEVVGEFGDRQRDWLGCVLPEDAGDIEGPSPGMQCRFVLRERLGRLAPIEDDVARVLSSDLLVVALLARRGVEELEWQGARWLLSQSEERLDGQTTRVTLKAQDEGAGKPRQWVLFCATYQPSRDAIARFLEHRQIRPKPGDKNRVYAEAQRERRVEVFCPLDEAGIPEPPRRGQAYALLATGVSVPIGLHVQADWLLVTSRRELMEVETNEWHREILARLAGLLRSYLQWVAGLRGIPDRRLREAYAVLPDWCETEGAFVPYLRNPDFREALRSALSGLPFLPVRSADAIQFATPVEARLLPAALRLFDDARMLPWALFGCDVISTTLLGPRALGSLEGLELLQSLTVDDLVARWDSGMVGRWREGLGGGGTDAHLKLVRALGSLDDDERWRGAPLRCLPSAGGGWIDREHAVGLPAEWDSIPEVDPPLRSWLDPFLAPSERRLEWSFDRALQRDSEARQYVAGLNRNKLEEVLGGWWAALPDKPSEDHCAQVLDATCWVLMKQRQRPGLVLRALCDDDTLPASLADVVLADPYATHARRRFFQDHRPVSGQYLHNKPGYSDADWRSFFEAASKAIKGPFRLTPNTRQVTPEELREAIPEYKAPDTKVVPITARWRDWSFYSDNYLLIDTNLPEELSTALTRGMTPDEAHEAGLWLSEARQELPRNARLQVAYVPYNSSSVCTVSTGIPASWVRSLQGARWVAGSDGTGPYTPDSVLARADTARPEAPVAGLPGELVKTLESCGLRFGSVIPEVASVERLRREGPLAGVDRLLELLNNAIVDTRDDTGRQDELLSVLRTSAIIPVPEGAQLIDSASRVSAERLVQRGTRGAELGGWLLSVETVTRGVGAEDAYARLVRLVASVYLVLDAPTWEQALGFLRWVWQARPDAELVRRTLPRAYRLIADDINAPAERLEAWGASRDHAMVYVASRKWVSVTNEDLFLDDLGDERLKGMVGPLLLATPGHLGETAEEQHRVAKLLRLRRLSSRFQVRLDLEGEQVLPERWAVALNALITLVQSYAQEEDGNGSGPAPPVVTYYRRIRKSLIGAGAETNRWDVHAARDGVRVCLSGEPDDFAADLCRVLLQWAGLASRRDLDELAPTITQLIGWMDRPEKFGPRLAAVRAQRGLDAGPASVPESPPPAKTPPPTGTPEEPTVPTPRPPSEPTQPSGPTPPAGPGGELPTGGLVAGGGTPSQPVAGNGAEPPPASGGYTADDRERRLQALRKRRAEIDTHEKALLGVGPVPAETEHPADDGDERPGKFGSDVPYRDAAVAFERRAGRFAAAKDADQAGHDIDSFDKPLDDPERKLVRRIEVKGRGLKWDEDETVELSDRQFLDALARKCEGVAIAEDFDYWLYVVERREDGTLNVLPVRNPATRAAKFEFRGGTWRALAEVANDQDEENGDQ